MDPRADAWKAQLDELLDESPFSAHVTEAGHDSANVYRINIKGLPGEYTFEIVPDAPYRLSANGDLLVEQDYQGHKHSRTLITVREVFCSSIGIERIVIGQNGNDPFWTYFGYEQVPDSEAERYRELADGAGIFDFDEDNPRLEQPRHKKL